MMGTARHVLVVAGGKGLRMGTDLPKQFLLLAGKPVLMHTLEAFHRFDADMDVVLVLPSEQHTYWKDLCRQFGFAWSHRLADGGETRYHSVKNGLALIGGEGLVAIHDGVRPLVSTELIGSCFAAAEEVGAVIPVFELTESLRRLEGTRSVAVPRDAYRSVQTPQTFRLEVLRKAYTLPFRSDFTDDASVVEAAGYEIGLVDGCRRNIKITTPPDLVLAEYWLKETL